MCMLIVLKIPGDQDIYMRCDATRTLLGLREGDSSICLLRNQVSVLLTRWLACL
jgi:hypothetical protein